MMTVAYAKIRSVERPPKISRKAFLRGVCGKRLVTGLDL